MNADIQTLEQILNRILQTKPAGQDKEALLEMAYQGIKSAIAALEQYQAQ